MKDGMNWKAELEFLDELGWSKDGPKDDGGQSLSLSLEIEALASYCKKLHGASKTVLPGESK